MHPARGDGRAHRPIRPIARASRVAPEPHRLDDAARNEQHDQGHRDAVDDEPQIADAAQEFRQDGQQDRAADRPDQRAHAADDDHGEDGEGFGDEERVGHQRADEARIEAAGGAGDRRADAEGKHLPRRRS